jgi:flagellar biosynthetic protein FliR
MDWLPQLDVNKFVLFTLVLVRVSGLVVTAPIYGGQDLPAPVRALLAFALAVLIFPTQWNVAMAYPGTMVNYLVVLGGELLIGLSLGMGVVVLFSGIQLAGETIGRTGGLMAADVFDPTLDTNVPLLSRLMFLVTLAVFVLIGGHRIVMAGLLDTFQSIPIGRGVPADSLTETFVLLLSQSFALGVRAAVPSVTALLLATLVMGLISRTMPQLNILMVGFGMNAMLTFGALALSLGAAVWVFQEQLEPAVETLLEGLHAPLRMGLMN